MGAIATLRIDRAALMASVFSQKNLYHSRDDEKGPLRRIMAWLYDQEGGVNFSQEHLRIGTPKQDYALLYYFEGKRYKILWNGNAYISGADPEDMFEADEKGLQSLIDSILADALHRRFARMASNAGAKCGKAKVVGGEDADGRGEKIAFGIMVPDGE